MTEYILFFPTMTNIFLWQCHPTYMYVCNYTWKYSNGRKRFDSMTYILQSLIPFRHPIQTIEVAWNSDVLFSTQNKITLMSFEWNPCWSGILTYTYISIIIIIIIIIISIMMTLGWVCICVYMDNVIMFIYLYPLSICIYCICNERYDTHIRPFVSKTKRNKKTNQTKMNSFISFLRGMSFHFQRWLLVMIPFKTICYKSLGPIQYNSIYTIQYTIQNEIKWKQT